MCRYTPAATSDIQFYSYPKLISVDAPSRGDSKFETIGQTATLTYVTVTDNYFTEGRQIFGVNISLTGGECRFESVECIG